MAYQFIVQLAGGAQVSFPVNGSGNLDVLMADGTTKELVTVEE